jgi:hypothetical protein
MGPTYESDSSPFSDFGEFCFRGAPYEAVRRNSFKVNVASLSDINDTELNL